MSRFSVRLKRTGSDCIHEYQVEAADQAAADALADTLAANGGGGFDLQECEPESAGGGLTQAVADTLYEPIGSVATHEVVHAPSNAQKNSDITKAEIEAVLTGEISSHTHAGGGGCPFIVGTGFIDFDGTADPAVTWPGTTWAKVAAGQTLIGLDAGDPDFAAIGQTGGAKTVAAAGSVSAPTITVDPLTGGNRKGGTSNPASIIENGNVPTATASTPTFTGSATSVVQPYTVVYFWKRTA